ncbi:hypothetical protein, partial [Clostridium perfringens]
MTAAVRASGAAAIIMGGNTIKGTIRIESLRSEGRIITAKRRYCESRSSSARANTASNISVVS